MSEGTPVVRIQNLNDGDKWYYSDLELPDDKYCHAGDLLFAWSATFGPYFWRGERAIYHYHIWKMVPSARLDKRFAYYLLRNITDRVKAAGRGISMIHMTKAGMEAWEIELPPLDEQRRIAAILDKADALRRKRKRAIGLLDALTQSIFLEMFGDPATNPKNLEWVVLGDVIHRVSDGPHVSPVYSTMGIPFLSTRHVQRGRINWDDLKFISAEDAVVHWKKCRPQCGDILYTKGGTTGLAAVVDTDKEFAIWVHIALLKTDVAKAEPYWLEAMLNSEFCYAQSQRYTHGIANRDLGLKRMVKIEMYLPSKAAQRQFVKATSVLRRMMSQFEQVSTLSLDVFSSLQTRAFSVSVVPAPPSG